MSGYTPVFSKIYAGTLYGKWPAAAVWASLLPLADKNGVIAYSWQALSGMTGWPMELLRQGIEDLMLPDPGSNSQDEAGKRLVPHDQHGGKDWGWRAVNHGKYREKARLQQREAERVASGQNAARMAARKEDPRRPPLTPADPLSDSDADTDSKRERQSAPRSSACRLPEDFSLNPERAEYAKAQGIDPKRTLEEFRDYWRAASGSKARKCDWDATWRTWCRRAAEQNKPNKGGRNGGLAFTPIN